MSSPYGRRGSSKDIAPRGRGSGFHLRGTFGSIRGSGRNAVVGFYDAIIQGAVATDQENGTERPVKINKTLAITFLNKTEMVDLIVGPEKALFRVHKSFLCSKIPYFEKMFNGGFKEAKDGSASFPEDFPEAFDILTERVYSGNLRWFDIGTATTGASWNFLKFYSLVEKICLTRLADFALDIYRKSCQNKNHVFESPPYVQEVYSFTSSQPGLRRLFIQQLVWRFQTQEDSKENANDLFILAMRSNDDIFTDFMFELRKHVKVAAPKDPRVLDPNNLCEYHSHIREEDCYFSKQT